MSQSTQSHYAGTGPDVIEFARQQRGDSAAFEFCVINAIKYCTRCGRKENESTEKDLRKAIDYLNRATEIVAGQAGSEIPAQQPTRKDESVEQAVSRWNEYVSRMPELAHSISGRHPSFRCMPESQILPPKSMQDRHLVDDAEILREQIERTLPAEPQPHNTGGSWDVTGAAQAPIGRSCGNCRHAETQDNQPPCCDCDPQHGNYIKWERETTTTNEGEVDRVCGNCRHADTEADHPPCCDCVDLCLWVQPHEEPHRCKNCAWGGLSPTMPPCRSCHGLSAWTQKKKK